jgi:hypothetical protein
LSYNQAKQWHALSGVQVKLYLRFGTPRISVHSAASISPDRSCSTTPPRLSPRLSQASTATSLPHELSTMETGVSKGILRMRRYLHAKSRQEKSILMDDFSEMATLVEANKQSVDHFLKRLDHQDASRVKDMYGVRQCWS